VAVINSHTSAVVCLSAGFGSVWSGGQDGKVINFTQVHTVRYCVTPHASSVNHIACVGPNPNPNWRYCVTPHASSVNHIVALGDHVWTASSDKSIKILEVEHQP